MTKIVVVNAGQETFGITISAVVEILNEQRVFLLPELPSFLSGVVNIRGEVIPLLDLRKRFGIVPAPRKERIIVVRSGSEKVGLLVDGVEKIVDLRPGEISSPPSLFKGLRTEYLTGIGKSGDTLIILLNLDTLLTAKEKIQLEEVTKTIGATHAGNQKPA